MESTPPRGPATLGRAREPAYQGTPSPAPRREPGSKGEPSTHPHLPAASTPAGRPTGKPAEQRRPTACPGPVRAPRGRAGDARTRNGPGRRALARTRSGPGPAARRYARTHDARAGSRPRPGSGRPGRRRGRWEAPFGALPSRHVHSPIVKDIPVAGRQPRPSGHFFPLPALRERRALPPLPLHRARLLGAPPPPPPPGPPLAGAAASAAAAAAAAATCRGCSGPRAPALRPQSGARPLCRPLGPLPALASPRSGGPLRPPARARGPRLRVRPAGPAPPLPAPPRDGDADQRAACVSATSWLPAPAP